MTGSSYEGITPTNSIGAERGLRCDVLPLVRGGLGRRGTAFRIMRESHVGKHNRHGKQAALRNSVSTRVKE